MGSILSSSNTLNVGGPDQSTHDISEGTGGRIGQVPRQAVQPDPFLSRQTRRVSSERLESLMYCSLIFTLALWFQFESTLTPPDPADAAAQRGSVSWHASWAIWASLALRNIARIGVLHPFILHTLSQNRAIGAPFSARPERPSPTC